MPERRAKALDRLKRYVGLVPGSTPTTTLARQRYEEKLSNTALLQPTQREVEQALANVDTSSPPAKFTKHTKPTDVGVCSSLAMTLRALWPA
ncbi:hypothetical protein ACU11_19135 [Xanthomonas oryzae pv. oryzicola]|nr:hypothetical protein ACU11_19135 [Xanthomonas oryzae pv. oryzicola]